jgi:flagellar basal-body rod protein FlgG
MLRGLYTAASAMVAQLSRQDVYANNLANANSVGFRRGRSALGQFQDTLRAAKGSPGQASAGAAAAPSDLDLAQGPLTQTNRPLDMAISGDAFFCVRTAKGTAYTRDGRFQLDSQSRLTTLSGELVLGERGPITITTGELSVAQDGELSCGGKAIDRLRLMVPIKPTPLGNNLYSATQTKASTKSTVNSGMLEQANVNAVEEMGRMLSGYRYYEAGATALRYQDETLTSLMKTLQ